VKNTTNLRTSLETLTDEAIRRFWSLAEFLGLGTPKQLVKMNKDIKKRKKLPQK